mmetsp:Transcript_37983/g.62390  ORF Transcript_37983/g.62390 Transcript_37983/m.62390 type:complete len:408 (-) Transcript_37983:147-1370(-)|eukprot:CAMPEP_0202702814 /NCGR_PEP_ID=MMETSP1385-20130828/15738_1 /ASSEMBLY_ACC=CAM_ASM_000861 /TAXON_ID=933848 /ORGANISM="Elphidium margaritaceum" /LENGTH=407 /DNA_ID=CAMNT_0049360537 /DNA_START=54 /DNA_END=1277 /DNA_ORIENTATION=-
MNSIVRQLHWTQTLLQSALPILTRARYIHYEVPRPQARPLSMTLSSRKLHHLRYCQKPCACFKFPARSFCTPVYVHDVSQYEESLPHDVAYTMDMLKELRAVSGAPLKECKQALVNTKDSDNRITAALDYLRVRGKAIAQAKSGDIAKYGFIGMFKDTNDAALVEVNCVTDFVENNPIFQTAVMNIGNTVYRNQTDIFPNYGQSIDELNMLPVIDCETGVAGKQTIHESLTDIISSIRENLVFRRAYKMHCSPSGVICGYLHGRKNDNLGMKGSLVSLETDLAELSDAQKTSLKELGQNVATHIVANYPQPKYVSREELSEHQIEKEKELITKTILDSGSDQKMEIVQKQVDGRMKKFFMENVLMEQPFCLEDDNKLTIERLVKLKATELKCDIRISHMVVYNLGQA